MEEQLIDIFKRYEKFYLGDLQRGYNVIEEKQYDDLASNIIHFIYKRAEIDLNDDQEILEEKTFNVPDKGICIKYSEIHHIIAHLREISNSLQTIEKHSKRIKKYDIKLIEEKAEQLAKEKYINWHNDYQQIKQQRAFREGFLEAMKIIRQD